MCGGKQPNIDTLLNFFFLLDKKFHRKWKTKKNHLGFHITKVWPLEHFIKHRPLISEEYIYNIDQCKSIYIPSRFAEKKVFQFLFLFPTSCRKTRILKSFKFFNNHSTLICIYFHSRFTWGKN